MVFMEPFIARPERRARLLHRPVVAVLSFGIACAAVAQVDPRGDPGTILQTVPQAPKRPDSGPVIEDRVTRPRAIVDVEGMRLEIKGFRIVGLTVAASDVMVEELSPFVGPDKRFQDLLDAAAAIKRRLAGMGFFLADVVVPEQKIADGIVALQVLEGRLGKVRLDIDPAVPVDRDLLQSYVAGLEEGGLIRTDDVERALFQIHDLRGIVATSSFAPGTASGTADLTIRVAPAKRMDANIDFDANGSVYTGIHRVGAGIDANSLFGKGDLLSLRANNAIDGHLRYARLSLLVPMGPWGTKVGGAYSDLDYRLGTPSFESLKVTGSANVTSLTLIHPIIRSRNNNLLLIAQNDMREYHDLQVASATDTRKKTPVKSISLSGDFRDRVLGGGINVYNAAYTLGQLKFGTSALLAADLAGRRTSGEYAKTNVTVSRLQAISERLAFYGSFSQQFTNKNLDPSEKFSLGGPNAVRAYPQGEGAGDEGFVGTYEFRYRVPVEEDLPGSMVVTGFYDFGRSILIKQPTAADKAANTAVMRRIGGLGVGLNWEVPNNWYLRATLGFRDTSKATADHLLRFPRFYMQFSKFF
jgi:hemolysin activation/secretion protein